MTNRTRDLLVAASRSESDECILLSGWKTRPKAHLNGQRMNASKAVWILANGDPGDQHVLHTCHDPWCVNIRHLYLGDHARNMSDKVAAGRSHEIPKGSACTSSILTETDVLAIRRDYRRRQPGCEGNVRELASKYGVSTSAIFDIMYRRSWAHF